MSEFIEERTLSRVLDALNSHLRPAIEPFVSTGMTERFGPDWVEQQTRPNGRPITQDAHALLKIMLDHWLGVFRERFPRDDAHRIRAFVATAYDARNRTAHPIPPILQREGIRFLDAMAELAESVDAPLHHIAALRKAYEDQAGQTEGPLRLNREISSSTRTSDTELKGFRQFLVEEYISKKTGKPLSPNSANSYCSYVRSVKKLLGEQSILSPLSSSEMIVMESRLKALTRGTTPPKIVGDWMAGVAAFSKFQISRKLST